MCLIMNVSDLFWKASAEEMKKGYIEEVDCHQCLLCGKRIDKGIIYQEEGVFYEAYRYMRLHIEKQHGSVFEYLMGLDKKFTGLTEHQNSLLRLFYQGKSDEEVQKELEIGSTATIRNHRFVLKEKERQARVFLTLMELLKERSGKFSGLIPPHDTARMVDDRYSITEEENEKTLKKFFHQGLNGPLRTFDMKEKSKLVVLRHIAGRFDPGRTYSEKEVNEILKGVYGDFATLRRYLVEYGFMDRKSDGSRYWLKQEDQGRSEENMDRKKELKEQYKEIKTAAGVYQIRNLKNRKVLVETTPNLKTINGRLMQLRGGVHKNRQLQADWENFGEEAFVFEVLEVLEEKEDAFFDKKDALKKLGAKWLEKLQPYGEKGYNKETVAVLPE